MKNAPPIEDYRRRKWVLRITSRWFIPLSIAASQIGMVPGLALWLVLLNTNAELSRIQLALVTPVLVSASIIACLFLVALIHLSSRTASARLAYWSAGKAPKVGSIEEMEAWKQITRIPKRLGILSLLVFPLVLLLPCLGYLRINFAASNDQLIYALMGGAVAILGTTLLSVLLAERALASGYDVLIPTTFETQLAGFAGLSMRTKFVSAVVILISISVLLLAPIGYHMSYVILYQPLGSEQVFEKLRSQLSVASAVVIALGLLSALLISDSIASPIRHLVDIVGKVEKGDLQQQAKVFTADEVGTLTVYFNRMISRLGEFQTSLEERVSERTSQLEATLEVGHAASAILDPDELIAKVTELISDRFGYYYAAIFLIDDSGAWAELKQATGEAGKILMQRHHRLPMGGKSMVSSAIQARRGRIALDVGNEAIRFDNPLLPATRSEIALPLMTANRTWGALDVQSKESAAFDESDINTLQSMANQVAVALENAHLFRETENALQEVRAAQSEVFDRAWSDLAGEGVTQTYEVGSTVNLASELNSLEIPLQVRDRRIGSITVEATSEFTAERKVLLEALATQTSLALENARLITESQQAAMRERLASAIVEKIWSSPSVESILQTSIHELGRALDANEASIELKIEEPYE